MEHHCKGSGVSIINSLLQKTEVYVSYHPSEGERLTSKSHGCKDSSMRMSKPNSSAGCMH